MIVGYIILITFLLMMLEVFALGMVAIAKIISEGDDKDEEI